MTVEEIFKELATHALKGMMVHEEMCNYYDFLGLKLPLFDMYLNRNLILYQFPHFCRLKPLLFYFLLFV